MPVTMEGTTGKGERKARDRQPLQRFGCPFRFLFSTTEDGQQLGFKKLNDRIRYNHEITDDVYTHHPRICRLDEAHIKEAEDML